MKEKKSRKIKRNQVSVMKCNYRYGNLFECIVWVCLDSSYLCRKAKYELFKYFHATLEKVTGFFYLADKCHYVLNATGLN